MSTQAESTGSAATALGGAVNQALSGLQSSAQGSFNALPSAPISVPDIDLSPRLLQSSVATNLTDAMTFTPTPAMMGVGVAAVVAASVIASKVVGGGTLRGVYNPHYAIIMQPSSQSTQSKDVSNLERTVADLESQRTDLGQKITTLENSLNSTQKELTDALTAEQARVAQLQRTLEQETQAAATAADTAAKEQAALRTKIDVCVCVCLRGVRWGGLSCMVAPYITYMVHLDSCVLLLNHAWTQTTNTGTDHAWD